MAGVTLVKDSFTGLGLDVTNHGRVPAITNTGNAWIEETGKHSVGGGSDDLKYVGGGSSKLQAQIENLAVKAIWYDGGEANIIRLVVRDSINPAYPRYGYSAFFFTRDSKIQVFYQNNYTLVQIGSDVSATFDTTTGVNECVFEVNGDDFRVIVNDVLVHSFTDTMFTANGNRNKIAIIGGVNVDDSGRLQEVELFDSYVIPGDTVESVPIVMIL